MVKHVYKEYREQGLAMQRRQFVSLGAGAAAVVSAPAWVRSAAAQEGPGLNARSVLIGCTAPLSGPIAGYGVDIQKGVTAAFSAINARGGIQGRSLQFQLVDDAYSPERSISNVKQMFSNGSAMALLSCLGTANNAAILPVAEEAGIPSIGPISGAGSIRKNSRNVFHVRASYGDEAQRLIKRLTGMGLTSIGVIHQDVGFGPEVGGDAVRALESEKVQPALRAAVAIDSSNINAVVKQVAAVRPAALFLATSGVVSTDLVKALRKHAPGVLLTGVSVTMSSDNLAAVGDEGSGMALTMIVPDPNRTRSLLVRDYQAAMRAKGFNDFSPGSLEAYVNARVLAEGLDRAGRDPTPARLRSSLASIRQWDMGGFVVDYSGQVPYVGSRYIDLGVLGNGGRFIG